MISARAGVIAYAVGAVYVDGKQAKVPYQMHDGETLETTGESVAELLLLPNVFLRLDQNSAIRMEDTTVAGTRVTIQQGSVFYEAGKLDKDSHLLTNLQDCIIEFDGVGIFQVDAREGRLLVYNGKAIVTRRTRTVHANAGRAVALIGDLTISRFDTKQLRTLLSWAAQRTLRRSVWDQFDVSDDSALAVLTMRVASPHPEEVVFRGNLEKIAPKSLSLRLKDGIIVDARLPESGPLSAATLSEGHQVGDRVEIACNRFLPPDLELTRLRASISRPKLDELSSVLASPAWRELGNLLGVPAPVPTKAARSAYTPAGLIADEIATRSRRLVGAQQWEYTDTIESKIRASDESHRDILRNGIHWARPFDALPGFQWRGAFVSPLDSMPCLSAFQKERTQAMGARNVSVYKFIAPKDGCLGGFTAGYQRFFPEFTGQVFVDESSGHMLKSEEKTVGMPLGFDFRYVENEIVWDDIKIGDASHVLPVTATFQVQLSQGVEWSVKAEYKNYHFEK
jgi:hypothetical protein